LSELFALGFLCLNRHETHVCKTLAMGSAKGHR
jgi:hypothetical protein